MKPYFNIFFLSLVVFNSSCQRTCKQGAIYFRLEGYDSIELSSVVVKKYTKGSGFASEIGVVAPTSPEQIPASAEYDWIIEIPLAGRSYSVRDIKYKNDKDGEKSPIRTGERDACTDGINYVVDDNSAGVPTSWGSSGSQTITLKK